MLLEKELRAHAMVRSERNSNSLPEGQGDEADTTESDESDGPGDNK